VKKVPKDINIGKECPKRIFGKECPKTLFATL
jgi:hypothetical protein